MALADTLQRIASGFDRLAGGRSGPILESAIYGELASAFSQLAEDLAATPGWGAPTGTATRTTFDTGTVTLPQLAERMKGLLDDLRTRGTISA